MNVDTADSVDSIRDMVISIEGPACTGKTTVARLVGEQFNVPTVHVGRIMRGLVVMLGGSGYPKVVMENLADWIPVLAASNSEFDAVLDAPDIGQRAAELGVRADVKVALRDGLRKIPRGFVIDGRDLSNYLYPDADVKFHLAAAHIDSRITLAMKRAQQAEPQLTRQQAAKLLSDRDEVDRENSDSILNRQGADVITITIDGRTPESLCEEVTGIVKVRNTQRNQSEFSRNDTSDIAR